MSDNNNNNSYEQNAAQQHSKSQGEENATTETTFDQEETIEQDQQQDGGEEIQQTPISAGEAISTTNIIVTPPPSQQTPSSIGSDAAAEAATSPLQPSKKTSGKKSDLSSSSTQILGYGPSFPDKLFERLQLKVDVPAGGIRLRFQLTKSVIISFIPDGSNAVGVLDAGDWIRAVDGTKVDTRRKVYSLLRQKAKNEAYSITFNVKRPLRNVFLTNEKQIYEYLPPVIEILPGYSYLLTFLSTFPGARLGLHVKSYENRVYVSSISHGSLSEAVFHIGDIILSVDDVAIASVSDAHKRIQDAFTTKNWVQTVVERAESKIALQRMNVALKADRRLDIDPKMAEDIAEITGKEIKRMKESENEAASKKGILRKGNKQANVSISISQASKETPIQCDPVNLKLLLKVPPNRPYYQKRKSGNHRVGGRNNKGFGSGQGFYKHSKTANGISYTEFIPSSKSSTSSTSSATRD